VKSYWPTEFHELEVTTPKEIIEQQLKYLPTLTGDKIYGELTEISKSQLLFTEFKKTNFAYKFYIKGKFLKNYSFEAFQIVYNIDIYPVEVSLDDEIENELGLPHGVIELDNQEDFVKIFESVLKSKRVKNVIGAIMKLS